MQWKMLGVAAGAFDTLQKSSVKCCWSRDVPCHLDRFRVVRHHLACRFDEREEGASAA